MKRFLLILTTVLLPYLHCLALENVTINGLNYLLDSSDRSAIVSTQSTSLNGAISIPSSVTYSGTSYSVKGLASKAFQNCDGITSVAIPSSITTLSSYCFYDCDNLTNVTIPTSVTSIGDYCFRGCSRLSSITIPSSVTSIGSECFYFCSSLTNATINANVTSLPSSCFQSCSNLTSVSIPNTVTSLGSYCFSGCSKLSSITLPSGLKTLNNYCFQNCSSLTNISLPASVTSIGSGVFNNCTGLSKLTCNATTPPSINSNAFSGTLYQYGTLLVPSSAVSAYQTATTWKDWKYVKSIGSSVGTITNATINGLNYLLDSSDRSAIVSTQSTSLSGAITIPSSVTYSGTSYSVKGLASKAFQNCDGITSVAIPSSITALSSYCFYDCDNLTSVTIPTSVTSIGDYCFRGCSRLSSITIPSSVKTLGAYCFAETPIQTITIPSSVTSIGSECFYFCSSLTNATINANVTSLPSSCFQSCSNLTSVSIPNTVTSLGSYCFSGCSKLSSITLPSGLKTLNNYCFQNCSSLTNISLPASVTSIGSGVFNNCTGLSKLTCNATTPPSINSNAFTGTLYQYGTLLVPSSAVSAYQAATTWKDWKYVKAIGSSVGTITNATINGLNYLLDSSDRSAIVSTQSTSLSGSISIPSSVTYSGTSYSVKGLASKAFYNCDGITSVTIPSSITALSNYCFYGCDYLTSVTIPISVTSIGDYCFNSCNRLSSISLPSSVKTLGQYCFAYTPIQTITIPSSVTSIGEYCFYSCSNLTNATINANVTSLPYWCFRSCSSLTSVSIPSSVTSLGSSCFSGCSKLSSITLPSGLKTLNSNCFSGCSALTEISLPASVTNIYSQCFYNCAGLSKLTCNATTPPSVSSDAFTGTLYQYGTLLVPSSAVSAYQAATTWKDWKYIQALVVAENIVYLSDATTAQNTTKQISVKLKNDSQITNFQFDVYLPTGVTMATSGGNYVFGKGSRLASSHSITCAQQSDGAYRFFCYSASNALITGSDGEIMNFTVQVPSSTSAGEYTITIRNAKVAETNGTKYTTEETSAKLTVTQGSVPVTGITLNSTSVSLIIGGIKSLTATITPSNATNKNVTWSSSNTSVATVSTSGLVTAVGVGSATITCTAADGSGKSATCAVTVTGNLSGRSNVVTTNTAETTVSFSTTGTYEWEWDSENSRLRSTNYNVHSSTSQTTMNITTTKTTKFSFDYRVSSESSYDKLTITLDGTTIVNGISGTSSNSYNSVLTAGTHTLVFKYTKDGSSNNNDDRAYLSNVKFTNNPVTGISLNKTSCTLVAGKTEALTATVTPSNATNAAITWSSSNTSVATVSTSGVVTAVSGGTATISCTAADGSGTRGTCSVTVIARGDVNGDGTINAADITGDVKFILGESTTGLYADAADYNNSGSVTTADAISIVRLALTGSTAFSGAKALRVKGLSSASTSLAVDDIFMTSGATQEVSIGVADNHESFTSMQFDVTLPDGVTIDNVTVGNRAVNHASVYNDFGDGTVRVICYSLDNEDFLATDGDIIKLTLKSADYMFGGIYDVDFSNILLVRNDVSTAYTGSQRVALTVGEATNVNSIERLEEDNSYRYNAAGQRVSKSAKGIIITNGKKIVIK